MPPPVVSEEQKVWYTAIFKDTIKPPHVLASSLSQHVGFFARNTADTTSFLELFASTAAAEHGARKRMHGAAGKPGTRDGQYRVHGLAMEENGLFAVLISGKDYPDKAAAGMLHDVLEDFTKQYPSSRWATENPTFDAYAEKLKGFMKTWQDPRADNLTRTMKELEDTKGILFDTMDSLLQRGEKMSDLVEKSDKLSQASKMFYKDAKQQNSCCILM